MRPTREESIEASADTHVTSRGFGGSEGRDADPEVDRAVRLLRARFVMREDTYLSETRRRVDGPLTDETLRRHLVGLDRIGSYPTTTSKVLCFDADGKTPNANPKGRAAALREARAIAAVLDADLSLPPALLEESRSGIGFHVWMFFDASDPPSIKGVKRFGRLVLRAANFRDDEKEPEGAVGIYPHPPGAKGYGKTPFMPLAGYFNGGSGARFVDLSTAEPFPDQLAVLDGVRVVTHDEFDRALAHLGEGEGPIETSAEELRRPTDDYEDRGASLSVLVDPHGVGKNRHDVLRGEIMRLRSFLPIEETRAIGYALARQYSLLAEGRGGEVENMIVGAYLKAPIQLITQYERERNGGAVPTAIDLYDPSIEPRVPEFTVKQFIRRVGIHLIWAIPGGLKTWTLLTWLHELLLNPGRARLCDHPDLWINRRYQRVLWIATEEEAEVLRFKAERIRRGLIYEEMAGEIRYLFAVDGRRRITLDDLPAIYEAEGPLDAVVLDSLTGLRPKVVNGEKVRWDIDNDAANEACLQLRGLAKQHQTAIFLIHHTGRDTKRGYRGATDWWASADVMIGFQPDGDRSKVIVEKNRDARKIAPFVLEPSWGDRAFELRYVAAANSAEVKLTPTALKVLDFFGQQIAHGRRNASQKEICGSVSGSRSAVLDALQVCVAAGRLHSTGLKDGNSPIYGYGAAADRAPEPDSDSGADNEDD